MLIYTQSRDIYQNIDKGKFPANLNNGDITKFTRILKTD